MHNFDCEKYKNYQLDYFHLPSQGATRRKMDGGGVSGGKGEWLIVWRGSVEGVGSLAPSKKSTCQIPNNLLNLSTSLRPEPDKESRYICIPNNQLWAAKITFLCNIIRGVCSFKTGVVCQQNVFRLWKKLWDVVARPRDLAPLALPR